jgi:hypothetical protein
VGYLALVYLILLPFGLPSPCKELYLALATCSAVTIFKSQLHSIWRIFAEPRESLAALAASLREIPSQVTISAGDFAGAGRATDASLHARKVASFRKQRCELLVEI